MTYPRWVLLAPDIGSVLCTNEAEEAALLKDWAARQKAAQKAADAAEANAAADVLDAAHAVSAEVAHQKQRR